MIDNTACRTTSFGIEGYLERMFKENSVVSSEMLNTEMDGKVRTFGEISRSCWHLYSGGEDSKAGSGIFRVKE